MNRAQPFEPVRADEGEKVTEEAALWLLAGRLYFLGNSGIMHYEAQDTWHDILPFTASASGTMTPAHKLYDFLYHKASEM